MFSKNEKITDSIFKLSVLKCLILYFIYTNFVVHKNQGPVHSRQCFPNKLHFSSINDILLNTITSDILRNYYLLLRHVFHFRRQTMYLFCCQIIHLIFSYRFTCFFIKHQFQIQPHSEPKRRFKRK